MGTTAELRCERDRKISDSHSLRRMQRLLQHRAVGAYDPENVAAEVIARSLHRRPPAIPFIPWARPVARRLVTDEVRRRSQFTSKAHLLDVGSNHPSPDDVVAVIDVRTAIAQLPAREREAVAFRYYLDLPVVDVARNMRVSTASARSTLFRARRTLSELLGDRHTC